MFHFFDCSAIQGTTDDSSTSFEHLLEASIFSNEEVPPYSQDEKSNCRVSHKRQASNGSDSQGSSQEEIQGQFPFFKSFCDENSVPTSPSRMFKSPPKRQRLSEARSSPKGRSLVIPKIESICLNNSHKKLETEECLTPLTPSFDLSPGFPSFLSDDIFDSSSPTAESTILPTVSKSQCRHPDCNTISPETV